MNNKRSSNFKIITIIACFLCFFAVYLKYTSDFAQAETNPIPQVSPANSSSSTETVQEPSSNPQATKKPPINPITEAAVKMGVLTSAGRINQVVTYLMENTKSRAYIFPVGEKPDEQIFSLSFELLYPDAPSSIYASADFAPILSGGSNVAYETVQYVDYSCETVAKKFFNDAKLVGTLAKSINVYNTKTETCFLMPAGKGCVVIRKRIIR